MNSLVALWLKSSWRPLLVLGVALAVRLVYNYGFFEHRICHTGDSYYYLTTGNGLARLISTSHNWSEFCGQLWQKGTVPPGSFQSFSSENLTDRLLLDGPVFPSYLALLFILLGPAHGPGIEAFNVHSTFFASANSIVDSLSCLFLYFLTAEAFGVGAGLTAGLLLALYGPSIINTQQCYSEPFAYFLLLAWSFAFTRLVLHPGKLLSLGYLLFGVLTGLVMLSKPAFVIVPALGLAVFFIGRKFAVKLAVSPPGRHMIAFPLGVALILLPWLSFTGAVSGRASLLVNRAPEYNLFIGNHLPSDGWKTWPTPGNVPQSMTEARARLLGQFQTDTEHSVGLIFRKIPRLFAGVWNEFQYEVVGLNLLSQNLVQGLLLLLGWLGFAALLGRRQREEAPRQFCLALTLATVAAYHLVYALFEPVPRYAITALPLVIALGAGGLFTLFRSAARLENEFLEYSALVVLALFSAVGFYQLYTFYSFIPILAQNIPDADFIALRGINCCIWLAFFTFIVLLAGLALSLAGLNSRLSKVVISGGALLMVACCLAFFNFDPAQAEWFTEISDGDSVQQILNLPASATHNKKMFLLVDCQTDVAPPHLAVRVNGKALPPHPWLIWHELRPADKDVHVLLHIQSNAMASDFRLLRQWWAYPLSSLKEGDNLIELVSSGKQRVKIYGDFLPRRRERNERPGDVICMPSFEKFSWTKGFLSFDHRDPRTYETVNFEGRADKSVWYSAKKGKHFDYDLSDAPGLQTGLYRIRAVGQADLAAFGIASVEDPSGAPGKVLFAHPGEFTVRGDDPSTMTLDCELGKLPRHGLLRMTLEARKDRPFEKIPVEITLSIADAASGRSNQALNQAAGSSPGSSPARVDDASGKSSKSSSDNSPWTSWWQPNSLRVSGDWSAVEYSNFLPDNCAAWDKAEARILFAPFPADRLYLHKKQALKDRLHVRNVQLTLLPTRLPQELEWHYY